MQRRIDSEFFSWDCSVSPSRLTVRGDWTLNNYTVLGQQIARLRAAEADTQGSEVDLSGLGALDTAGVSRLFELPGIELDAAWIHGANALSPGPYSLAAKILAHHGGSRPD